MDVELYEKKQSDPFKTVQILLLLDNCTSHSIFWKENTDLNSKYSYLNLKHIFLVFLPKNTTSVFQPLDVGVIYSFKMKYKSIYIEKLLKKKYKI